MERVWVCVCKSRLEYWKMDMQMVWILIHGIPCFKVLGINHGQEIQWLWIIASSFLVLSFLLGLIINSFCFFLLYWSLLSKALQFSSASTHVAFKFRIFCNIYSSTIGPTFENSWLYVVLLKIFFFLLHFRIKILYEKWTTFEMVTTSICCYMIATIFFHHV